MSGLGCVLDRLGGRFDVAYLQLTLVLARAAVVRLLALLAPGLRGFEKVG